MAGVPPQAFVPNPPQMVHPPSQFLGPGSMPSAPNPYQPGYPFAYAGLPTTPPLGWPQVNPVPQSGQFPTQYVPQHILPQIPQPPAQNVPVWRPVNRVAQPLPPSGPRPTPSVGSGWVPSRLVGQGGTHQLGSAPSGSALTSSTPLLVQANDQPTNLPASTPLARDCSIPLPSIKSSPPEAASQNESSSQQTRASRIDRVRSDRSLSPDTRPREARARSRGRSHHRSLTPEVVRLRRRDDLQHRLLLTIKDKQLAEKEEQLKRERDDRSRSRRRHREKEEMAKQARERSRERARAQLRELQSQNVDVRLERANE